MENFKKYTPPRSQFSTASGFQSYKDSASRATSNMVESLRKQSNILKEASLNMNTNGLKSMTDKTGQIITDGYNKSLARNIGSFISGTANETGSTTGYEGRRFQWGNKRFNSSGEHTYTAYSPRQYGQMSNAVITSNGSIDTVIIDGPFSTINNIIGLSQLAQICGLPPLSDNIVDPSPTISQSELSSDLISWGNGQRVGKEYIDRVLMRGQYLVLVPIELKAQLGNVILESNIVGKTTSSTMDLLKGTVGSVTGYVNNFLDSLDNRMGVTTYGYNTKVNHRRYWLAVGAHMKAVLHCLGIDELSTSMTTNASQYNEYLKNFLPDFIVEKIFDNGNWKGIPQVLGAGGDDSEISFAGYNDLTDEMKSIVDKAGGALLKKVDSWSAAKSAKARFGDIMEQVVKNQKGDFGSVYKRGGTGMFSVLGYQGRGEYDDGSSFGGTDSIPISLYNSSYSNILAAVTNIDLDKGEKTWNLPFITFYCNGPIERNLNFSLTAEKSKIAETITDVGSKTLKGAADFMKNVVSEMSSHPAAQLATNVTSKVNEAVNNGEDLIKELVYHQGATSDVLDKIITNTYIPKVVTDGSTSQSWTVNIREVAAGSDKYSQARMFWTLCLLLPMVLQKTRPRQPMIIPTNPMYCAAFSKGVMNCPRAYISSMSIKTDPAFQTTNGVPLELDITLTIEPLFTVTTMPDFTDAWGGVSDINLLNSMWNPMSSFNMIATLSGANTVLSRVPSNIFKFFVGAPVQGAFNKFRSVFGSNGGYFATYLRDWRRSFDLEDNYTYIS